MVTCGRHGHYGLCGQVLASFSGVGKETQIPLLLCLSVAQNDEDMT